MKRVAVWRKGDWEVRSYTWKDRMMVAEGYRFRFEIDGLVMCEFTGVPDYKTNQFKLRGFIGHRYWYIPTARELPFGCENKEFEIEIS